MQSNPSSPFNLRGRLSSPKLRLNTSALASIILIAFFMFVMTSKYIFAPGLTVSLNSDEGETETRSETLSLPLYAGELPGEETTSVLTVKNESMFIIDGRIYRNLTDALPPADTDTPKRGILLAKIGKSVRIQTVFDLAKAAQDAGFSAIQIAGESNTKN